MTHRSKDGQVKQVDFLSGVAGLTTKDLVRRAIEMEVPEIGHLRVIHPLDVLDSRIQICMYYPRSAPMRGSPRRDWPLMSPERSFDRK